MLGSYKLDSKSAKMVLRRLLPITKVGEKFASRSDTVGHRGRRRTKPPRFFAITFSPPIVPLLCRNRGSQDDGRHRPPNRSLKTRISLLVIYALRVLIYCACEKYSTVAQQKGKLSP